MRPLLLAAAMLTQTTFGVHGSDAGVHRLAGPSALKARVSFLHAFKGQRNGWLPMSPLTVSNTGVLYGATAAGGVYRCYTTACGTVFSLTANGGSYVQTVLHRFRNNDDGAEPMGPMVLAPDGMLYGATVNGGNASICYGFGCGTVFAIKVNESRVAERVVYRFTGAMDGAAPSGGLIADAAGNLYGTASSGGMSCSGLPCGTVFRLTRGKHGYIETTLHAFTGGPADGATPAASLMLDAQGDLYGTTQSGGAYGGGTVFRLTPKGSTYTQTVLYSFGGYAKDALFPQAPVIVDSQGNVYGTTPSGGTLDVGTVFELSPNGSVYTEKIIHNFGYAPDAHTPYGGVTLGPNGTLYGTGSGGGSHGAGAVFALVPDSRGYKERVVYSFSVNAPGGGKPNEPLTLEPSGTFLGTTEGCSGRICGSVFRLSISSL